MRSVFEVQVGPEPKSLRMSPTREQVSENGLPLPRGTRGVTEEKEDGHRRFTVG